MRRRSVVLALVTLLLGLAGAVAGIVVDRVRGPEWSAETGVVIRMASPDVVLLTGLAAEVGVEDLVDAAAVARSEEVLTRAATQLGSGTTWTALADEVTVEPVGSSHIIKVTATAPDRAAASRTADAVAAAYVATTRDRVRAAMATLETVPRPPDPERQGGSDVTADVRSRAVVLGRDVTLAETFRTDEPRRISPSVKTPAALGIVGLAAGALAAVALTLLRPAASPGAHAAEPKGARPAAWVPRPPAGPPRGPARENGHETNGHTGLADVEPTQNGHHPGVPDGATNGVPNGAVRT